jgi:hypothetical protein
VAGISRDCGAPRVSAAGGDQRQQAPLRPSTVYHAMGIRHDTGERKQTMKIETMLRLFRIVKLLRLWAKITSTSAAPAPTQFV